MKDDPSISGKKTVEESVVESSWMWVDGVFQDGLINNREKPKIVVKGESEEEKTRKSLKENYQSLGKIGVNLNQISHYFNLEHLKSFDVLDPKIENILLLDRLQKNELIFLRENLG